MDVVTIVTILYALRTLFKYLLNFQFSQWIFSLPPPGYVIIQVRVHLLHNYAIVFVFSEKLLESNDAWMMGISKQLPDDVFFFPMNKRLYTTTSSMKMSGFVLSGVCPIGQIGSLT